MRGNRSLRFWQKTYLVTLAVFVAVLDGGLALTGLRCYDVLFQGELDQALSDQRMVAQNLARDIAVAREDGNDHKAYAVAFAYDAQFANKSGDMLDVSLDTSDEGRLYMSSHYGQQNPRLYAEPGEQQWQLVRFSFGEDYIIVGGGLGEGADPLYVTWAHSLAGLKGTWFGIVCQLLFISCIATVLGAVGLLLALRSLARPLDALARITDEYAAGDTSVRACVRNADEIGTLAMSFNNLADTVEARVSDLQAAADANARMAASLSHETRTPLTAIRGYAEYLQFANATPDERRDALASIIHESNRLHSVSERMLQLFALDGIELERERLSLSEVAAKAVTVVEPRVAERDVRVMLESAEVPDVLGDAVLLESLVINLIDNAVNASEPGTAVRVLVQPAESPSATDRPDRPCTGDRPRAGAHPDASSATHPPAVLLRVKDEGRGLTPEETAHLGEPFYRPDKARSRVSGGAGLGLSLVLRIAQLHTATVHFDSTQGLGTCVTVALPCDRPVISTDLEPHEEGKTDENLR